MPSELKMDSCNLNNCSNLSSETRTDERQSSISIYVRSGCGFGVFVNCLGFKEILEQILQIEGICFRDSLYSNGIPYFVSLCYDRKTELPDIFTILLQLVYMSYVSFPS